MDSEYVLEMKNICKRFPGVVALDHVSLRVRPGTVHALMGENGAGKSTLMKCLFGMYHAEEGEIVFKGKPTLFPSTKAALDAGVSMIHQELANVPDRSVQENIWLGREPTWRFGPFRALRHHKMRDDTIALMKNLEMEIRPDIAMGQLSISHQQACEIAKAVSCNASIVVMDEPTSSITDKETEHLFRIIRDLKSKGVAIIYISHKMHEIFQIADEISVMRDGRLISTHPVASINEDQLIKQMVGRDTSQRFPPLDSVPGATRLKVKQLTSSNPRSFKDISLDLRQGEILGIGGLVGAQRTEFVEALFGLRTLASGNIEVNGRPVEISSSRDAIRRGIGLITEDRRASGIFPQLSITTNTSIPSLANYRTAFHGLQHRKIAQETKRLNCLLRTKTPSMETPIQNLSGGNQQKVLIARWLMISPDILIMDEPTRGIDVGAKYEIYSIMVDLVRSGKSIIMVSSEMPELIGMSHRIMVLCEGRYTGTLQRGVATQDEIMRLATKYM